MYIGNLADFFNKDKNWLINQPKITKENKYQFLRIGGKIFKLNIYTGVLYEINNNNNNNQLNSTLHRKSIIKDENKKKIEKNISILKNKNKFQNILSNEKIILNNSSDKKNKKDLNNKRNKSSNIKSNFSLTSRNNYKNKVDKSFNLYLNKKYALQGITKRNKHKENFGKLNCLTFDINNKNRLRSKFYNFPNIKIKKSIDYDNDSDNIFIQDDICEIKKDDNGIITKVKNQIFKDKMFRILRKKYNFFKEDKNPLLKIPKLRLDTAQNIYIDKKKPIIKRLYLNKTARNKKIVIDNNI